MPELSLHRLEGVVDHLGQRLVPAIVVLLFFRDQLVTAGNGHIDAHPVRIAFLMRMIGLLNRNIAAINVIAEFLEPCRVIVHELVNLRLFFPSRDK